MIDIDQFFLMPGLKEEIENFKEQLSFASKFDHVLIRGPRGSGKSYFLKILKENSPNVTGDFIHLNCATIPPGLATSELFGYTKGAFTGANQNTKGLIEYAAENGVIVLDEFNSLSREDQAKLLVFMETYKFYQLGGREEKQVKVRIVALANDVETKEESRQDVIDRFAVVADVPPIHQRRMDIFYYIAKKHPEMILHGDDLFTFYAYNWPGNFRELSRTISRKNKRIAGTDHKISLANKLSEISKTLTAIGLTWDQYKIMNEKFFGGVLPYTSFDGSSFYPFNPSLSCFGRYRIQITKNDEIIFIGADDSNHERKINVKAISIFFKIIFGLESVSSEKPIQFTEPFTLKTMQFIDLSRFAGDIFLSGLDVVALVSYTMFCQPLPL